MKIENSNEGYQITTASIEGLRELDSTIYEKMVNMLGWKKWAIYIARPLFSSLHLGQQKRVWRMVCIIFVLKMPTFED